MTVVVAGLACAALVAAWVAAVFRGLQSVERDSGRAWTELERQLCRRHDLVPALVAAVREHAPGESVAVERLVAACTAAAAARSPYERGETERTLVSALGTVAGLAERHTVLARTGPFVTLQAQLATIEDEIQAARRIYNAEVRLYLKRRGAFPGNVLGGFADLPERPYFELDHTRHGAGLRLTASAAA
jgi:LemA protein